MSELDKWSDEYVDKQVRRVLSGELPSPNFALSGLALNYANIKTAILKGMRQVELPKS